MVNITVKTMNKYRIWRGELELKQTLQTRIPAFSTSYPNSEPYPVCGS